MTSFLNKAIAAECKYLLIEHCKTNPFSTGTESSSDAQIQKINQASICISNIYTSNHFYDIC